MNKKQRKTQEKLREKSDITREEHCKKFENKIQHLNKKYRESLEEKIKIIPSDIEELSRLGVFNPEKFREIKEEEYEIEIIGDIELSENEMKVLKLHPKFAILPRLVEGGLDLDEELANSKLRMQLHKEIEERKGKKEKEDKGNNLTEEHLEKSDKERIEEIELEAKSRQVFDPIEKTYNERKRRATDLREFNSWDLLLLKRTVLLKLI